MDRLEEMGIQNGDTVRIGASNSSMSGRVRACQIEPGHVR